MLQFIAKNNASFFPAPVRMRRNLIAAIAALAAMAIFLIVPNASAQDAASVPGANTPEALRDKYTSLADQLKNNQFHRELYLESSETPNSLKGDVYAVVDYPFATVNSALNNPVHWCDVLILHLNIKYCKMVGDPSAPGLSVNLGQKTQQELKDTYHVDFKYRSEISAADYFSVILSAAEGPLNTSNYRIHLEAVALDPHRSFLHLTYSYTSGFAGRVAMKAYLATAGANKVGFTRSTEGDGKSGAFVSGVRGVVERNTMRYYLAIDAYLSAMNTAPSDQFEKRLQTWFNATERYSQQLHEVTHDEYVEMKRAEYQRQNTATP